MHIDHVLVADCALVAGLWAEVYAGQRDEVLRNVGVESHGWAVMVGGVRGHRIR